MIRRSLQLLCLLLFSAIGLSATTVSGNLKNAGIENVTDRNTFVRFELRNFSSNIPRVAASHVIAVVIKDFPPDANGNISGSITGNDTIIPAGTFFRVCIFNAGSQFRCADYLITGSTFDLDTATPITTAPVPGLPSVYTTILEEGTELVGRFKLNFIGSSITCADNPSTLRTDCTLTGGGGTPGGADTQIQFNDAGAFGGDADFTWNKTTNVLTLSGDLEIARGSVADSIRIGGGSSSTFTGNIALGEAAASTGDNDSIAIGHTAVASNNDAIAIGFITASGNSATAIGRSNNGASGNGAVAIGTSTNVSALNSIGIGDTATVSQASAVAIGAGAAVTQSGGADSGVAIGHSTAVTNVQNGIAIGNGSVVTHQASIALNGSSSAANQMTIGDTSGATTRINSIRVGAADSTFGILDFASLATSSKTFTFANASGTICTTGTFCSGTGTNPFYGIRIVDDVVFTDLPSAETDCSTSACIVLVRPSEGAGTFTRQNWNETAGLLDLRQLGGQFTGLTAIKAPFDFQARRTTGTAATLDVQSTLDVTMYHDAGGENVGGGPKDQYQGIRLYNISAGKGEDHGYWGEVVKLGEGDATGILATSMQAGNCLEGGGECATGGRFTSRQGTSTEVMTATVSSYTGGSRTIAYSSPVNESARGEGRYITNTNAAKIYSTGTISSVSTTTPATVTGSGTLWATQFGAGAHTDLCFSQADDDAAGFKFVVPIRSITSETVLVLDFDPMALDRNWPGDVNGSTVYRIYKCAQVETINYAGGSFTHSSGGTTDWVATDTLEVPLGWAWFGSAGTFIVQNDLPSFEAKGIVITNTTSDEPMRSVASIGGKAYLGLLFGNTWSCYAGNTNCSQGSTTGIYYANPPTLGTVYASSAAGNNIFFRLVDTTGGVTGNFDAYYNTSGDSLNFEHSTSLTTPIVLQPSTGGLTTNIHTIRNQDALRLGELTANGSQFVAHRAAAAITTSPTYTWPETTDNRFLNSGTGGTLVWSQVAFTDLTGTATAGQVPNLENLNGTLDLASGGTNQSSWTASRCVQVNAGGTALESASAACGSGGSGDNITINTTAATDANFNDTDPAAVGSGLNVKFQIDTTDTPDNISAYVQEASISQAGIVTTAAQTFNGEKTMDDGVIALTYKTTAADLPESGQYRVGVGDIIAFEGAGGDDVQLKATNVTSRTVVDLFNSADPITSIGGTAQLRYHGSFGELRFGQYDDLQCGDSLGFYGLYVHDNFSVSFGPDCVTDHQHAMRVMKVWRSTGSDGGTSEAALQVVGGVGTTGTQTGTLSQANMVYVIADYEGGSGHTATIFRGIYIEPTTGQLGGGAGTVTTWDNIAVSYANLSLATTVTTMNDIHLGAAALDGSFATSRGLFIEKRSGATTNVGALIQMAENTLSLQLEDPDNPANGSFKDAPILRLTGSYDSDAGAGVTRTTRDADIIHNVMSTTPASQLDFKIGGTVRLSILDTNGLDLGTGTNLSSWRHSSISFEGATDDAFETTINIADATADRAVNVPNTDSSTGQAVTCSGTDKVSAFSAATGAFTCTADVSGGSPTWNSIASPVGAQALTMGANNTTWTWDSASGVFLSTFSSAFSSGSQFKINATGAFTGGTLLEVAQETGNTTSTGPLMAIRAADVTLTELLRIDHSGDADAIIAIDSGSTAAFGAFIKFYDRGTLKWEYGKETGGNNFVGPFDNSVSVIRQYFQAGSHSSYASGSTTGDHIFTDSVGTERFRILGDADTIAIGNSENTTLTRLAADSLDLPGTLQNSGAALVFLMDATTETLSNDITAAFSTGSQWRVNVTGAPTGGIAAQFIQQTGNPTLLTLVDMRAADVNVTVLRAGDGTNGITLSQAGALTAEGTGTIIATDLSCTNCIGPTEITDLTLSTDTAGNYVSNVADGSGIDVTGTAGEDWTATVNLLYTDTLAGNPAMNADECRFSTDGTGGGIICEGAADTIEGLLVWNPATSDRTLTLPDATDTLVGKATTDILTGKTIDVEGTGNVITTVSKVWIPAATCVTATATLNWDDDPAVAEPAAACVAGTNITKGLADFSDAATNAMQMPLMLPADFTGNIDVLIKWLSTAITGNVKWQVATICVADAETDDPAFTAASTVTDTTKGTASQLNDAAITALTITGCAAGELMHLRVLRDPADAADTLGATARLYGVELTMRRAQ